MTEAQKSKALFLILAVLLLVMSAMASQQYKGTGSDSEELDPKDVEEQGCPRVTHLKSINLRKVQCIFKFYSILLTFN